MQVDDAALVVRIRGFLQENRFVKPPAGRQLPRSDESSYAHHRGY